MATILGVRAFPWGLPWRWCWPPRGTARSSAGSWSCSTPSCASASWSRSPTSRTARWCPPPSPPPWISATSRVSPAGNAYVVGSLLVLAGDPEVVAEESEGEIKVCPDKALRAWDDLGVGWVGVIGGIPPQPWRASRCGCWSLWSPVLAWYRIWIQIVIIKFNLCWGFDLYDPLNHYSIQIIKENTLQYCKPSYIIIKYITQSQTNNYYNKITHARANHFT